MPRDDAPAEGWNRFSLLDHDDLAVQWGDRGSLRFAADPAYVDGGYEYVVSSDDWPSGWVSRRRAPHPAMAGEDMDSDPPAAPREPR